MYKATPKNDIGHMVATIRHEGATHRAAIAHGGYPVYWEAHPNATVSIVEVEKSDSPREIPAIFRWNEFPS